MRSLTRDEARERAARIAVRSYALEFDLTRGPDTFGVRTTVRFDCRKPGSSTFIEHLVPRLRSAHLNGVELDLDRVLDDGRIALDPLLATNELVVEADAAYSPSLEGLQRSVDPEDGEAYLFSESFLDFGQRMFACFDQPDLKASFTVAATAPVGWTVLSNGAGTEVEPGRWTFTTTPPLPTYLFALAAGPYHSVRSEHDGIPLGLHCRQSMAPFLDADEIFEVTRQGLDYYHDLFGARYPFDKYDQLFAPEIWGAMENAALVTYMDSLLFRSAVTEAHRRDRAGYLLHELAHMWFGDLVTMRWWDDLWLNESFATYLAYRTAVEATRHRLAWTDYSLGEKSWGYRQDALPTTHPVSADVPDSAAALLNLDGISYTKGAGVIKQLVAWVGDDAFLAGLRAYIAAHAFGSTTLDDLLRSLETPSGRSLGPWSDAWLRTAGIATLRPTLEIGADGRYTSAVIEQISPPEQPTLRAHRIAIGVFDRDGERLVRRDRVEVDIEGSATAVPALVGSPAAALIFVNDDDLTWAKVRLDPASLATVRDGGIPRIEEPLARALLWMTVADMVRDAALPIEDGLDILLEGIAGEPETGMGSVILGSARAAIDRFGLPSKRAARMARLATRTRELLEAAQPGSDAQLAFARAYLNAFEEPDDAERVRGWLAGRGVPSGLDVGPELRWAGTAQLAAIGALSPAEIDAEANRDQTTAGAEGAALARAAIPSAAAKAAAWRLITTPDGTALGIRRATTIGFWWLQDPALGRRYVDRYFEDFGRLFAGESMQVARALAARAFPHPLVEPATLAATDRALAEPAIDPSFRRILIEQRDDLLRAQRTRQLDESAG